VCCNLWCNFLCVFSNNCLFLGPLPDLWSPLPKSEVYEKAQVVLCVLFEVQQVRRLASFGEVHRQEGRRRCFVLHRVSKVSFEEKLLSSHEGRSSNFRLERRRSSGGRFEGLLLLEKLIFVVGLIGYQKGGSLRIEYYC